MSDKSALEEVVERIEQRLDQLYNYMFVDNGRKSFQTRQDRQDRMYKLVIWAAGIIGGILILNTVALWTTQAKERIYHDLTQQTHTSPIDHDRPVSGPAMAGPGH